MEAIENLKSVLCDPDGKCCIIGSTEDRRIVDAALEALQAENARLTKECDSFEVANIAVAFERDKALARLAESEAQNLMARQIILEHGEGVAGASPVKPSQAQPPAPSDTAITYMTGYSDGREWAGATNQALVGALKDATQSLETISMLAGRKTYGNPPIETFMETFSEVRGYAISRAGVGREAIAAAPIPQQPADAALAALDTAQPAQVNAMLVEALEQIALAGMSGSGQESEEGMTAWHARRAWEFIGIAARALTAAKQAQPERAPLTDAEIEKLREKTFSTNNPFCPVDSKSMRKAVRAAEAAHGIKQGGQHD